MEFEYVPAVKDAAYFDDLRGRIYGIISDVAARTFHDSSAAFERSIGEHLGELTMSITRSLGFDTRLALPRDLYHIFERLDFLSGEKSVSLNNRGDGIKARHIPLILKFMAEKKAQLLRRGGQPISSIWAYEEPENNLEIASAVQLADELHELANAGTAQVLLTTHSPAFYDLAQREEDVTLHYVTRPSDPEGTTARADASELDESLGTLAMLAPRISEMVRQVRDQEAARHEASRLAEQNCPRIFVEGESDRIVLARAIGLFFPETAAAVAFETKREGAGHNYVIDMLLGWRSQHKHHPERPRAAGIVDGDAAAQKNEFNRHSDNIRSAKCFAYPVPTHLQPARAAAFRVPVTLEALYPRVVWEAALAAGRLVRRNPLDVYPDELVRDIALGDAQPGDRIDPAWRVFVDYDFSPDEKIAAARRMTRLEDDDAKRQLAPFELLLKEVLSFLDLIQAEARAA
jgi:hypothetical protein